MYVQTSPVRRRKLLQKYVGLGSIRFRRFDSTRLFPFLLQPWLAVSDTGCSTSGYHNVAFGCGFLWIVDADMYDVI